jgi:alkylation response protein AidB-like acyl-CoA dehydrogenase
MTNRPDFWKTIEELSPLFAEGAAQHDEHDLFVTDNFAALRARKVFSATVPKELGGGGVSHREMARALRTLARHCGSTALSLSMHQHLVAAQVWNHLHGKPAKILQRVAAEEIVLISTGANDWLSSSGTLTKVDGGYRLNAVKAFASGSPCGDLLMTSAQHDDPEQGPQVLHFPVALNSQGVSFKRDWRVLGMRATGSDTILLENVFVPEQSIALRRERGAFHPVWSVILTVAMPYIMSVYVGVAEAAAAIAREQARKRSDDPVAPYLVGEMQNHLATAQMAVDAMVDIANDWQFEPTIETASAILTRKTIAANACIATAEKALEAAGGAAFFRKLGLEQRLRDTHAGQFHPLPEKRQQLFTGRLSMGLDPVGQ